MSPEHDAPSSLAPAPGVENLVAICGSEDSALLLERARVLSRPGVGTDTGVRWESYVRLRVGADAYYGVPYCNAEEIMYVSAISRVPGTPPCVRGVIHRRGEMLAVLDLKALFALSAPSDVENSPLVVVSAAGLTVGLLVDEIVDSDEYDPQQLAPPLPAEGLPRAEHVLGLHDGTVAVLNLDTLLGDLAARFLDLARIPHQGTNRGRSDG